MLLSNNASREWRSATSEEISKGLVEGYECFDDQPLANQDEGGGEVILTQGQVLFHLMVGTRAPERQNAPSKLACTGRIVVRGTRIEWIRCIDEVSGTALNNVWTGTGDRGFAGSDELRVVQTAPEEIQRVFLMTTDPGDLVLDPTCGSGTTACVAETWGRRRITCDTSRVAFTLAKLRLMTPASTPSPGALRMRG